MPVLATPPAPPVSDERSLLWVAVQSSTQELELLLARALQGISLFGLLIAVWVAAFVDPKLGLVTGAIATWGVIWFTVAVGALRQNVGVRWFRNLNPIVEVLLPVFVLIALVRVEGPEYALSSWVPPQLFAVVIAASMLRLRPDLPVLMGSTAAGCYALAYWGVILPVLGSDPPLLHQPRMQLVRVLSLCIMGGAAGLGVLGLRRVVGRADRDVRSQDLFGKYRLGRTIAQGGMGRVVEALYCPEGGFKRRVAIKIIHPELALDPNFLDDFRYEAELCSRLTHPNIVGALDFGRVGDTWFFAMEYVDGPTLHEVLRVRRQTGHPIGQELALHLAIEIAVALQFAHSVARDEEGQLLRVIHRDLTPTNVLLDRSGRVRISDFGVARAMGSSHRPARAPRMVGKPGYMAPEQVRGLPVDERADLWGLGVIVWEMVCNRRLFGRDDTADSLDAVLDAPVPVPSAVEAGIGPWWDDLITQLLERDPDRRLPTADVVLGRLRGLLPDVGATNAEEVAELVASIEDVPLLDLDSTDEFARSRSSEEEAPCSDPAHATPAPEAPPRPTPRLDADPEADSPPPTSAGAERAANGQRLDADPGTDSPETA